MQESPMLVSRVALALLCAVATVAPGQGRAQIHGPDVVRHQALAGGVRAAVSASAPQSPQASSADSSPEAVLAVVRTLFDGMREADSTKVRSVFAEGARFASVAARAGGEAVQYTSVDGFVASVGRSERRWDERVFDVEVRVDDGMAVVWAPYTFYLDGQVRHCGVNLMDFSRVDGAWKITQLTDTRRMEGCRQVPPGGA